MNVIVRFDDGKLTLLAESEAEREQLQVWSAAATDRLFALGNASADTLAFGDAGAVADVRRLPINITFDHTPMPLQLISNLAETPFVLDGRRFTSIEGFWQGLKFADEAKRSEIAALAGHPAKSAGHKAAARDVITYAGRDIRVGTIDHWALMERACAAKFEQCEPARVALLSTGTRPLEHRVPTDSRTIPGVIMADIWMRLRSRLLP